MVRIIWLKNHRKILMFSILFENICNFWDFKSDWKTILCNKFIASNMKNWAQIEWYSTNIRKIKPQMEKKWKRNGKLKTKIRISWKKCNANFSFLNISTQRIHLNCIFLFKTKVTKNEFSKTKINIKIQEYKSRKRNNKMNFKS